MGKRPGILIGIGVALLILGAAIVFLVANNDKSSTGSTTASVVFASSDIKSGETGAEASSSGLVTIKQIQSGEVASGSIGSTEALQGSSFAIDVKKGDQITSSMLKVIGTRPTAIVVPKDKQAIAVTIPYTAAGGGYVRVGDHISLTALVSSPPHSQILVPDVEVLDVSSQALPVAPSSPAPANPGDPAPAAQPAATPENAPANITFLLSLTASQVEQVTFASAFNQLWVGILPTKGEPQKGTDGGVSLDTNFLAAP